MTTISTMQRVSQQMPVYASKGLRNKFYFILSISYSTQSVCVTMRTIFHCLISKNTYPDALYQCVQAGSESVLHKRKGLWQTLDDIVEVNTEHRGLRSQICSSTDRHKSFVVFFSIYKWYKGQHTVFSNACAITVSDTENRGTIIIRIPYSTDKPCIHLDYYN